MLDDRKSQGGHILKIQGQRVILRTTSGADLAHLMALWNDGRVMKWVGFPNGLGYDQNDMNDWFGRVETNPDRNHFVVFTPGIGFCGEVYYAVEKERRRAGLDIKLLPGAQGQGLATDALQTLIDHVFKTESEVDQVWTQPSQTNNAARRLYTRCGLKPGAIPADLGTGESFWVLSREAWSLAASHS
jgi:RimJ/RimL family protein N-acetyltransferase